MTTATINKPLAREPFGAALRRWRELRRVSQLELALRAGTTQRHLSFIEQGRSAPGRSMVIRLAESLELPLRDRNALLVHAGFAPAYPESTLDDNDLQAIRDALNTILTGHEPYPAMIVNRAGELILANPACDLFFHGLPSHLLRPPVNTRRVAVHPDGLAGRITNFSAWAPHVTESLRRELERNPDARLHTLLQELEGYVPDRPVPADHLGFAVPLQLSTAAGTINLITTITTFTTATDVLLAELRMEAFLPADSTTSGYLHQQAKRHRALPRSASD